MDHLGVLGGLSLSVALGVLVASLVSAGDFSGHPPDRQEGRVEAEVNAAVRKRGEFGGGFESRGLAGGWPVVTALALSPVERPDQG